MSDLRRLASQCASGGRVVCETVQERILAVAEALHQLTLGREVIVNLLLLRVFAEKRVELIMRHWLCSTLVN